MKQQELEAVLRPKVQGGWNLHRAVEEIELDFFVLFSSAAAVWGSRHMAHYAAANSFLDALAHYRRGLGLPALSVNWARLSQRGMQSSELESALSRIGVGAIPMDQALEALGRLIQTGRTQATVAAVDWQTFRPIYEARGSRPFLQRIGTSREEPADTASAASSALVAQLRQAPPAERKGMLCDYIQGELACILGFDADQALDPDKGFFAMGMDSLSAVELRNRLQTNLAMELPSALLFEHSSAQALAGHLAERLSPSADTPAPKGGGSVRDARAAAQIAVERLQPRDLASALEEELRAVDELLEGS